jgi:hypothetical protein
MSQAAIVKAVRTARRSHRCESCPEPIEPGQRYRDEVVPPSPSHDNWWRLKEHEHHAERYWDFEDW